MTRCCCCCAGKYFTLMQALPCVAATAFHGLFKLFDVYFYTVATAFTPQQALQALFTHFEAAEMSMSPTSTASSHHHGPDDPDAFPYRDPIGTVCSWFFLVACVSHFSLSL